jgi:hypothetical protein
VSRLLAEIERVLLRAWDPIGIQDDPSAADEYDSYAAQIYLMMRGYARRSARNRGLPGKGAIGSYGLATDAGPQR